MLQKFDGLDWPHVVLIALIVLQSLGVHIVVDPNSVVGKFVVPPAPVTVIQK